MNALLLCRKLEHLNNKFPLIVTGVGSRNISDEGAFRVKEIASLLNEQGAVLRSGGAEGADTIFEESFERKEIFLPWKNFNNNCSLYTAPRKEAYEIVSKIHPKYFALSLGAKKLHARNVHQVLGFDLNSPSDLCVCWTKDSVSSLDEISVKTGGTATAIRLALINNIPVFNLKNDLHFEVLKTWLIKRSSNA